MTKTHRQYTREMYKQFRYFATWLPGTPVELGAIVILKRNVFTQISHLKNEKIDFKIRKDETKSDLDYSSKGSVSVTTKLSGTVAPTGSVLGELDSGISVEFGKEDAILFKANETLSPMIDNQILLGKTIIERFKDGKWDKDWVIVTEVVEAKSGTILISSSNSGKIELKVTGNIEATALDIANSELNLQSSFSKDLSTKIIAQEGLIPLFKVSRIKSRLFLPPVFKLNRVSAMNLTTPEMVKNGNGEMLYFEEAEFEEEDEN